MSTLENIFLFNWKALGGPKLTREYRFHPDRKWRFDFAIPEIRVAVEVQGGTYSKNKKSGHTSGVGCARDFEKNNAANLAGWSVFYFDAKMVRKLTHLDPLIKHTTEMLATMKHVTF